MKTSKFFLLGIVLAGVVGLGGCATPEARIQKHPDIVARLAPEQLALIEQGQVHVGFDMDMVRLAVGEPDHVRLRAKEDGGNEVWSYATYATTDGQPLYRGLYHRYYLTGDAGHPFYLNDGTRQEHDHFRLVFKDDKVIAIEKDVALARLN